LSLRLRQSQFKVDPGTLLSHIVGLFVAAARCAWAQLLRRFLAGGFLGVCGFCVAAFAAPIVLAQGVAASAPTPAASSEPLRVGMLANFQPFQLWPEGALGPSGADVELLNLLSANTGQVWKLLRYTDVRQLETDLAAGRIDMAMSMARNQRRLARFVFSVPYANIEQGLLGRADLTSDAVSADLAGRVVAVVKDSAAADIVANNFPSAKRLVFESPELALKAVIDKRADLVFEALPALQQIIERERWPGLRVVRTFKFDEGLLRLAMRPADQARIAGFDIALQSVTRAQQAEMERRWSVATTLTGRPARFVLTDPEQQAIAALPPLRVGFVKVDRPFSYVNEAGEPAGLAIELLRDLRVRLGLRLDSVKGATVGELLADLAAGKLDVVLGVTETAARRQVAVFVGPYLSYPIVLVAKTGGNVLGLEDLIGHTLAVSPGYFANDYIKARFPGINFVDCGPEIDCLEVIASGRADATINNLIAASARLSRRSGEPPMQIVSPLPELFDQHHIALRPEFAPLAPMLKRALDDAVANELPVLQRKWLLPQVKTGVDPKLVQRSLVVGAVLFTALLLGWLLHTRILTREISARREAQGRAERATHERQRYLAFLAHEVRNSLNAVIGGISLLRQRLEGPQASVAAAGSGRIAAPELMGMVDGSARSTLGLLNDLLDYHRVDAGRLSLELRPARLADVAKSVIAEMQPAALAKGLTLSLQTSGDMQAWRQLDTVRVGQVLRNLLANAIKFTPKGGVQVRLHVGSRLSMAVQDSGIGVAPEVAKRLFEPFQQAQGQGHQGTGLGLALSRELMRAMGGDITLHSQSGAGALFSAEWPAVPVNGDDAERQARAAPARATATLDAAVPPLPLGAAMPSAQPLVLLVEDSPVYAITLQALLIKQGWQVRAVTTLDIALREFDQQAPQLLLCDLNLPDGTAFDLLSRISATRQARGLKFEVVVMTAELDPQDAEELRQAGADRVIEKAFDGPEMTRRVFVPA
jgi:two-component system, NarL family, sensor histidine kinase EvgS